MPKLALARVLPPALCPGDAIGIIAPAGPVDQSALLDGCRKLNDLGYATVHSGSIFDREGLFAGSVQRRVNELHEMFTRDDVKAILCARGGYGCNYLLPHLNPEIMRQHPKLLVGYSDVTTLLTWLVDQGMSAVHGPMVAKDFAQDRVDIDSWEAVCGGAAMDFSFGPDEGVSVLREGKATGTLYGGCLSLLVQSLGTRYEIKTEGKILFFEDINVHPYQLDRMLMHLKLARKLDEVQGYIFGEFCDVQGEERDKLREAILRVLDGDAPIVFGIPSGHVEAHNLALPMGVRATLVASDEVELNCESATQHS